MKPKKKAKQSSIVREDKSFHFRYRIHEDLIQVFIGYMALFRRYCRVIKNREVYFNISQEEEELVFELGISDNCDLKLSRVYLEEFTGFITNKDRLLGLRELTEGEVDQEELRVLQMRLLEQRKHLLIVIRLEFGLRNIIQFSESKIVKEAEFEEIERIKNTYELEIKNYETLLQLIKTQEENKHLLKRNSSLREQIFKIEKEKEVLLKQLVNVINERIIVAEKVVSGQPDKEKLENLVRENRIKEVFSVLKLTNEAELKKEIILLQNQWHELQKKTRLGMVNAQVYTAENARINLAILEIIEHLNEHQRPN